MSASEFIGRIEDLNETYDMIYLGSSTDGFNLSGGETDYNDPDMDGLLYSNVGDLYYSSYGMSGLLDRDYYWSGSYGNTIDARSGTKSNLFRFSGKRPDAGQGRGAGKLRRRRLPRHSGQ
jgi:hypothetical protein